MPNTELIAKPDFGRPIQGNEWWQGLQSSRTAVQNATIMRVVNGFLPELILYPLTFPVFCMNKLC
jgi:hypothetical protein